MIYKVINKCIMFYTPIYVSRKTVIEIGYCIINIFPGSGNIQ